MRLFNAFVFGALVLIVAHSELRYISNVSWMNRRVAVEREMWIQDVQSAAQAQMLIAINEGGGQTFGRSWELWLRDIANEYDK